jgi:hypothetical protein
MRAREVVKCHPVSADGVSIMRSKCPAENQTGPTLLGRRNLRACREHELTASVRSCRCRRDLPELAPMLTYQGAAARQRRIS